MADIDTLPKRGIPAKALVDGLGIAVNGSQTVAQLAARGMRAECAVDVTGVSTSGANMLQIVQRGMRAFCPVNELGIAQDASTTAATLRSRGIRPAVLLDANGVALNGSANMATLAQRGLQSFCPLDEAGNATTMGAVILISNSTVLDNASIGTNVGVLSVAGGTGTYTFTLTSNPGSLFATAGTNGVNLNTAAALTAGDKPITVQAAGGVPTPISRALIVTVVPAPTLPVNTVPPVISPSTGPWLVGNTLTTTDGTWTGFPAPGFTYQWNRVPTASAEVTAFLARTTGLDTTHVNAYTALIDGLVADGVWSKLDVLHIYATQDGATALLNLVQNLYNATALGSPTFTVDRGYTGQAGSSTKYLDTNFNPSTASSPKFVQNSAHLSAWSVTNDTGESQPQIGTSNGSVHIDVFPVNSSTAYFFMNTGAAVTAANLNGAGHFLGNRSSSVAVQGYKNGSSIVSSGANGSGAVPNFNIVVGGQNNSGSITGSGYQNAAASIGSSLNSTEAANFYTRLRTYMTAVGVPTVSAEATAFLARTSGLDATHTNAYTALINGLVADGIWAKLDVLHIYATQNSTTALLNLVSTSYSATLVGPPPFTADRGFTGQNAGSYINTNFNPSTAVSPKYTQNSAHFSGWNLSVLAAAYPSIGVEDNGSNIHANIYSPYNGDNNLYFKTNSVNLDAAGTTGGATSALGLLLGNRSDSTHLQGYINGVSVGTNAAATSTAVPNINMYCAGFNGPAGHGSTYQYASFSAGASLNSTEVANFYTRLRTYMTTMGVP